MAEFKNLTSQIEVIRSTFDDTISYYQKSNSDQVVQLGVYALDGDVYLSKVDASGNIGQVLETFPYSEITTPSSTSIDVLVEQINTWINDERKEVTVDTPFTGSSSVFSDLKQSKDYIFNPLINHVCVNDPGFELCVSIFNETLNKMLFLRGSEDYTATIYNNEVKFNVTPLGMDDGDILCIMYKDNTVDKTETLLNRMITEQEKTNKLITKYLS